MEGVRAEDGTVGFAEADVMGAGNAAVGGLNWTRKTRKPSRTWDASRRRRVSGAGAVGILKVMRVSGQRDVEWKSSIQCWPRGDVERVALAMSMWLVGLEPVCCKCWRWWQRGSEQLVLWPPKAEAIRDNHCVSIL